MCPYTGDLLYEEYNKNPIKHVLPDKLQQALELCNNPYKLPSVSRKKIDCCQSNQSADVAMIRTINLAKLNFFIARQYAAFRLSLFDNAEQSIAYFRKSGREQKTLCLPRSLFAAKTSKSFDESGVVLIGVFMPTRLMHAWVIEDQRQPDNRDDIWHHYRPIAAIC